ncbi:GNAT family N-acetyltransferase [Catenulispora yoronensis]|uniref:GNAT family N-acetyltransferase n=1 Tax=Catenulispora yoronensis TaxID=450799 RepID=A0ABP5GPG8_9ACTN
MGELGLAEVTRENFDAAVGVRVRPDQEHLVGPVMKSLAQAYVFGESAWPRLILDGGRVVGFLMAFLDIAWEDDAGPADPRDRRSGLWRLNIADGEQGRGYGTFAVQQVAAEIRRRGGSRLHVSWHPGDDGPEKFYLRLGFRTTGETIGGQTVGVLDLS